jgi:hypothetical protein
LSLGGPTVQGGDPAGPTWEAQIMVACFNVSVARFSKQLRRSTEVIDLDCGLFVYLFI